MFFSCQKEVSFEAVHNLSDTTCLGCSYFPVCDSSMYVYKDSGMLSNETTSFLLYKGDTTISSKSFNKYIDSVSRMNQYLNCDNGVLTIFTTGMTSMGGTSVSNVTMVPLKSNEPVGATWQDNLTANGMTITYNYKVIEKGITRHVLDSNYTNVIYVRDTGMAVVPIMGNMPFAVRHNYYARNVGLIESTTESILFGTPTVALVRKLKSYRL